MFKFRNNSTPGKRATRTLDPLRPDQTDRELADDLLKDVEEAEEILGKGRLTPKGEARVGLGLRERRRALEQLTPEGKRLVDYRREEIARLRARFCEFMGRICTQKLIVSEKDWSTFRKRVYPWEMLNRMSALGQSEEPLESGDPLEEIRKEPFWSQTPPVDCARVYSKSGLPFHYSCRECRLHTRNRLRAAGVDVKFEEKDEK